MQESGILDMDMRTWKMVEYLQEAWATCALAACRWWLCHTPFSHLPLIAA
jgi:hypothetical protein